jgi:hypothetical protein
MPRITGNVATAMENIQRDNDPQARRLMFMMKTALIHPISAKISPIQVAIEPVKSAMMMKPRFSNPTTHPPIRIKLSYCY